MKRSDFKNDHQLAGNKGMPRKKKKNGDELSRLRKRFKEWEADRGGPVARLTWDDEAV